MVGGRGLRKNSSSSISGMLTSNSQGGGEKKTVGSRC